LYCIYSTILQKIIEIFEWPFKRRNFQSVNNGEYFLKFKQMNPLTKNEMKLILGGSTRMICIWTFTGGRTAQALCIDGGGTCQSTEDAACLANDSCVNVDCR